MTKNEGSCKREWGVKRFRGAQGNEQGLKGAVRREILGFLPVSVEKNIIWFPL